MKESDIKKAHEIIDSRKLCQKQLDNSATIYDKIRVIGIDAQAPRDCESITRIIEVENNSETNILKAAMQHILHKRIDVYTSYLKELGVDDG